MEQWSTHAMEQGDAQLVQGLEKSGMFRVAYAKEVENVGVATGRENVQDVEAQVE